MYLFSPKYLWPLMGNSSSSPPKWPLAVQWVRLMFTMHKVQVPSLVGELRSHMHSQFFFFLIRVVLGKSVVIDLWELSSQGFQLELCQVSQVGWKWKSLSRVQLCVPVDYTVHEILQDRILEWVAFFFSRGSFQPRDWTQVSHVVGRFFTSWTTREAQEYWSG